eukprot:2578934-Pyramimonas_sp.AAC.1
MVIRRYRGVGTVGEEGGTVGLVPWEGKAIPWEVMLRKYWRYRGDVTVPWGWYFVGTAGLVPWVGKA